MRNSIGTHGSRSGSTAIGRAISTTGRAMSSTRPLALGRCS
jgi:hypothetical protein